MAPPNVDLKLRLTLREGTVYYFTERTLTSAEPHYFIVVNSDPLAQQVLLLSVVTSKVEEVKRRRAHRLQTLVELSPRDFDVLTKRSIVDCNSLKTIRRRNSENHSLTASGPLGRARHAFRRAPGACCFRLRSAHR